MRRSRAKYYGRAPFQLRQQYTPEEARSMYNRVARQIQRNLEEIGKSEFSGTRNYRENLAYYTTPSREISDTEIYYRLSRALGYKESRLSTLEGLRAARSKTIATLQRHNYSFINETNFETFTDFMEDVRTAYDSTRFDSVRVVEIFEEAQKTDVPPLELYKYYSGYRKKKPQPESRIVHKAKEVIGRVTGRKKDRKAERQKRKERRQRRANRRQRL